jgi:hypothetical protein
VHTAITLTAAASGVPNPVYRFWVWSGVTWSLLRDWGASTASWTPTTPGNYQLAAWVKSSGTAGDDPVATAAPRPFAVTAPVSVTNLAPYRPAGWSDTIVVATTPTSFVDAGHYSASATYYIAFAVGNFGPNNVSGRFYVDLYDNDVYRAWAYCDNLPSGYYCAWSGAAYSFSTPGTHALKMVVDSTGAVPETNEADNVYIKTISVNP